MTWVAVGMAALGVVQGDKNERKQNDDKAYKAELLKYAPYSQTAASIAQQGGPGGADSLTMGLQGAANGIGVSGALKKGGYFGGDTPTVAPEAKAMETLAPGMGPDGKPMSAEEQQKWNLLAQQQAGRLNA